MTEKIKKRLCLIDGSGYIYRAFFALPPMKRFSDGVPVNAVFGFTSMLMQFMADNADDCVAVVFDTSRRSFRNRIFSDYKANRKDVPEDLIPQFSLIRDVVQAFDVASVELDGYEADDLIASYAQKAVAEGYQVIVVSADKDLMQLMQGDDILIYDPMKKKYLTEEDVVKKFGVPPQKVIEVQTLMGDATDNIPGVHGIGPKTASELINQYGSVENVYEHLDDLTARKKELLQQGKEDAFVSKKLVTLAKDAPLPKDINTFCSYVPDENKIRTFLNLMGFSSLQTRLNSFIERRLKVFQEKSASQLSFNLEVSCPLKNKIERCYECIQDEESLLKWCEKIEKAGFVAFA